MMFSGNCTARWVEATRPLRDPELIALWSNDALYGPGAQSDDLLIFKPDGSGRYELFNWRLCSADVFRWDTPEPGVLSIVGERLLRVSDDLKRIEEEQSLIGTRDIPYVIAQEDTPLHGRIRVLRLPLERPLWYRFGFCRTELAGLDEPDFKSA